MFWKYLLWETEICRLILVEYDILMGGYVHIFVIPTNFF